MSKSRERSNSTVDDTPTPRRRTNTWLLLLMFPYLGLCFPGLYAQATPELLGLPFFYWYQFAAVIITSCLLGIVYIKQLQQE